MGKVTESIFDGGTAVIPLAEVCHVSKFANCIEIYFKSGRQLNLVPPDQNAFLVAWCRYRVELEADTLMDFEEAHPAPSIPEGWLRAIDEALVTTHIGVANADDTYEQAKAKLDSLISFHVDVAIEPTVNGGWKLVPIEPTHEMLDAGEDTFLPTYTGTPTSSPIAVYRAMLDAAPEAKP